jgi:hypothetical protein
MSGLGRRENVVAVFKEGFESVAVTPNSILFPGSPHFIRPGLSTSFTFPSGIRLVSPIPNNSSPFPIAVVGDFLRGGTGLELGTNGTIAAADVPAGTGYFGAIAFTEVSFAIDTPVFQVRAVVDSTDAIGPGMIAYDASGKLISAKEILSVPVANWDTNIIEIVSKVPIAKIAFTGFVFAVDEIAFDTSKPTIVKGTKFDDKLKGQAASEVIIGKGGNDKLKGNAGDDNLDGGKGNDKVRGGDGADTIIVGDGDDKVFGQGGPDTFVFTKLGSLTTLKDFSVADDTIALSRAAFTALSPTVTLLIDDEFLVGAAATNAKHRILYDPGTGNLSYDTDGNGPTAPVTFAKLPANLALTPTDFLVV